MRDYSKAGRPQRIDRWELIVETARIMERDRIRRWPAAMRVSGGSRSVAQYLDKKIRDDPDRYRYHARISEMALRLNPEFLSPGRVLGTEPVQRFVAALHARSDIGDDIKDMIHRDLSDHLIGNYAALATDQPVFRDGMSSEKIIAVLGEMLVS
jgi:hypothetical protein